MGYAHFYFLLSTISYIFSFNIDVKNTYWTFQQPDNDATTSFGYSVLLKKDQGLLVGAPFFADNDRKPGAVFRCNFNDKKCSKLDFAQDQDRPDLETYQKKEQHLGWSSSMDLNGNVMSCAPRWIQNITQFSGRVDAWYRGRCTLVGSNLNHKYTFSPCRAESAGNLNYGYCEAGFSSSADTLKVGATPIFYVGAPGAVNYKGTIIQITGHGSGTSIRTMFTNQDRLSDSSTYMGYSVSYGKFTSDGEIVGGAPRASNLMGKVIIYRIDKINRRFSILSNIENPDSQVGSYFGSTLLAVDLNNDGKDDLIVGAPLFAKSRDEGRAYVFMNKAGSSFVGLDLQSDPLVGSEKVGATFASSMAKIGDINGDGYQDVAIGAPNEDGQGAVYIYNGGKDGISGKFSQVIRAKELSLSAGFGSSLSPGVDVDSNSYNDIAIGAYPNGKVYVFRTRPVITMNDKLDINITSIPLVKNCKGPDSQGYHCAELTTTITFAGKGVADPFDVEISYSLDDLKAVQKRAFVNDNGKLVTAFTKPFKVPNITTSVIHSQVVYFAVKTSNNFDIIKPIVISVKYRGIDSVVGCGDNPCPIIDQYGSTTDQLSLIYLQECGDDKKCDVDLKVTGTHSLPRSTQQDVIVYGDTNSVHLLLKVENLGEAAYVSHMKVNSSSDLNIDSVDIQGETYPLWTSKSIDASTVELSFPLANPIKDKPIDVLIKYSISDLARPSTKNYLFTAEVFSLGEEKDGKNNIFTLILPTKIQTCISVRGTGKPTQVVYKLDAKQPPAINASVYDLGPAIEYLFTVQNRGSQPVDTLSIDIDIADGKQKTTLVYISDLTIDGVKCQEHKLNPSNFSLTDDKISVTDGNQGTLLRKRRDVSQDLVFEGESQSMKRRIRRETLPASASSSSNEQVNCRSGRCKSFQCSINRINAGKTSFVRIRTNVWSANLAKLNLPASNFVTNFKVTFTGPTAEQNQQKKDCLMSDQVVVTIQPGESEDTTKVKWWIILLAVLGAALLLAVIIALLYKFGFFERKRKIKNISSPAEQPEQKQSEAFEEDDDE